MSVNSLIYCPEGGEHEWTLWTDESDGDLVIDCDSCHQEAYRDGFPSTTLSLQGIPVRVERMPDDTLNIYARREV